MILGPIFAVFTDSVMFNAFCAFSIMGMLDYVWARYVIAVRDHARARAANMAAVIMLFNGVVTLIYVEKPSMIVPAMLGAWLGTWIGSEKK